MITLVYCLRRAPALSREEFQGYWRERHAPLVQDAAGALGIRDYRQLHTARTPLDDGLSLSRGGAQAYDGVALLSYESVEALAASTRTAEGRAAGRVLLEDERSFIDLAASPLFLTTTTPVLTHAKEIAS
jgi:uncharacterized protein (TIGR02118 family)